MIKAKKKSGGYKKVVDTSHQTPPGYDRKHDSTKELIKELCTDWWFDVIFWISVQSIRSFLFEINFFFLVLLCVYRYFILMND